MSCWYCAGPHRSDHCKYKSRREVAALPCETPSHNGPWLGSLPVRTIPEGIHGRPLASTVAGRARGHAHQKRSRIPTAARPKLDRAVVLDTLARGRALRWKEKQNGQAQASQG